MRPLSLTQLFTLFLLATCSFASPSEPIAGYLFAHMTHENYGRLYYSLSQDGLNFEPLNNGQPVLGNEYWGHADIVTGHDGRYYLMGNQATETGHNSRIAIWVSKDLIQWQELIALAPDVSHLMDKPGNNRGAPKIYYDAPLATYYITWHTSNGKRTPENGVPYWRSQRTFYVTSSDLETFSEPQRLFPWNMATIDVILEREGDRLYAFLKDEREPSSAEPTGKSIRMSWAPSIEGPWSDPGPSISPSFREAPTLYPRPDDKGWYLFYEHYTGVGYELSTAEQLAGPWYTIWNRNYSIPDSTRHGCIIALNQEQYDRLTSAYKR